MSQYAWLLVKPGNLLLLLLAAGTVLLFGRRRDLGRKLIAVSVAALVCLAILPIGTWILMPLENRFPAPETLPEHIEGIIVLGGALDRQLIQARRQPVLRDPGERIFALLRLARQFPEARIVYAGGKDSLGSKGLDGAISAKAFFDAMGIDLNRVLLEPRARNTYENAVFANRMVRPVKGQSWILVTSAWHMPRAVGAFRKIGWLVIPYPVDFRTPGVYDFRLGFNLTKELELLELGLQEWAALSVYRLWNRSDEWFPSKETAATRSNGPRGNGAAKGEPDR